MQSVISPKGKSSPPPNFKRTWSERKCLPLRAAIFGISNLPKAVCNEGNTKTDPFHDVELTICSLFQNSSFVGNKDSYRVLRYSGFEYLKNGLQAFATVHLIHSIESSTEAHLVGMKLDFKV